MYAIATRGDDSGLEPGLVYQSDDIPTVCVEEDEEIRFTAVVTDDGDAVDHVAITPLQYQKLVYRDCYGAQQHLLAAMMFIWGGGCDEDHALCAWPSKATIADSLGLSDSTIYRELKNAEKAGWLVLSKLGPSQSGHVRNKYYFAVPSVSLTVNLDDASPIEKPKKWRRTTRKRTSASPTDCPVQSERPTATVSETDGYSQRDRLIEPHNLPNEGLKELGWSPSATPTEFDEQPSLEELQKKLERFCTEVRVAPDNFRELGRVFGFEADQLRDWFPNGVHGENTHG